MVSKHDAKNVLRILSENLARNNREDIRSIIEDMIGLHDCIFSSQDTTSYYDILSLPTQNPDGSYDFEIGDIDNPQKVRVKIRVEVL